MFVVFWEHRIVAKDASSWNFGKSKAKMKSFTDLDKAMKFENAMIKRSLNEETYQQGLVVSVGNNYNNIMHQRLKNGKTQ